MSTRSPSLFSQLRRHRGLWVLVAAIMLIKLVAGAICLADGPKDVVAATATAGTSIVVSATDTVPSADAGTCVLGETGTCHCACAHAVAMPATAWLTIASMDARLHGPMLSTQRVPAVAGSLIRPPIA